VVFARPSRIQQAIDEFGEASSGFSNLWAMGSAVVKQ
jgi:hypothetical protein